MLPINPLHERTFLIQSSIHQSTPIVWLLRNKIISYAECRSEQVRQLFHVMLHSIAVIDWYLLQINNDWEFNERVADVGNYLVEVNLQVK